MPQVDKPTFFTVTSFESDYNNKINNLDYISNTPVAYQVELVKKKQLHYSIFAVLFLSLYSC